jgi:hypothetical protein
MSEVPDCSPGVEYSPARGRESPDDGEAPGDPRFFGHV